MKSNPRFSINPRTDTGLRRASFLTNHNLFIESKLFHNSNNFIRVASYKHNCLSAYNQYNTYI